MTSAPRHSRLAGFAFGLGAAACWGLVPVATKGALAGFSPEVVGVARLTIAALCFRILGGSGARWLPDDGWSWLAGIALGLDFLLFNYGLDLTTAALAGLLVNFSQVASVVLARLLLGEAVTGRRLVGTACTLAGVGLVNAPGALEEGSSLLGNFLIMGASVAWSLYAVAQRRVTRVANVFQLLTPIFVVAALVAAVALLAPGGQDVSGARGPLAMLAVLVSLCTIAPYLLYNRGQELLDIIVLTIVLASTPVFAVLLSWLVLDETIGWRVLAGGAVILAGIVVVALERR